MANLDALLFPKDAQEDAKAGQDATALALMLGAADPKPRQPMGLMDALAQTWPARMAKSAYEAAKLPGDVYAGRIDPKSDEGIGKAFDLAGLMMTGGVGGAPAGAIGSTMTRNAKDIGELRAALSHEHPAVDHWVSQSGSGPVVVNKVVVPPELRGKGEGTQFMRDVLDYADARGVPTALTPDSSFGGNKNKLVEWYRSMGFEPNKGRKADYSISESMVRKPSGN